MELKEQVANILSPVRTVGNYVADPRSNTAIIVELIEAQVEAGKKAERERVYVKFLHIPGGDCYVSIIGDNEIILEHFTEEQVYDGKVFAKELSVMLGCLLKQEVSK